MKKLMLLLVLLLLPVMVYAEDYEVKTLIPVDTKASIKTEKFDYNNFVYNSSIDEKGNSLITFESIKNNKVIKSFVSINILLFDNNQKNIGYVTYCSDKDLDSKYADFEIPGKGSVPFSINVVSKYFVEGKSTSDVKYISVLDDNKYCQIGGYDKYKGLTLDEIVNGVGNNKEESGISRFIIELQEKGLMSLIIIGLVGLAVLVMIIMIISTLIKKARNDRLSRPREVNIDVPVEQTVDLTYNDVSTDDTLEEEENVSMGDASIEEDIKEVEKEDKKEEEVDLTKIFK